jgi:hypothetical protein
MTTTLAVIERSHRGTVEQQYAHVLWLVHSLNSQSDMTVLLRGPAAVYALAAQPPGPVCLANEPWGIYPDYQAAISRLHADGAEIFVSADSLRQIGAGGFPLLPGVVPIAGDRIAALVARHDRWWFL